MTNKNKISLAIITVFYIFFIFLYDFILFPSSNNYFWCVTFNYFEVIDTYLPIHCDEGPYFESSQSIEYFFSESNPYQKRPLYILSISLITKFIEIVSFDILSDYQIFRISMLFIQCIIIFFIGLNFMKLFKIEKFSFHVLLSIVAIFSIPNIRWNLFYPSHGNLTLMLLLIALVKLDQEDNSFKSDSLFFITLGLGALFHRSAIIFGLILLLLIKVNFKINKFLSNLALLLTPSILYESFFYFSNFKSYDWNKEVYGQFYWLIDILRGVQNNYHDMSCQKLSTFYKCNFEVTLNFISYFALGFLFVSLLIYINSKLLKDHDIKNLILISIFVYIFWGLQGLYPNYRFINYSLGYFLFLFLIFTNYKYFQSITLSISIIIYQFSVLYLEPYTITSFNPNMLTYVALTIFIIFFLQQKGINKSPSL